MISKQSDKALILSANASHNARASRSGAVWQWRLLAGKIILLFFAPAACRPSGELMLLFDAAHQRGFRRVARPDDEDTRDGALGDAIHDFVNGFIELLPHKKGSNAPWVAYANEEGALQELLPNPLAWGVLNHLGFDHSVNNLGYYHGNVVLLGRDEAPLTPKDIKLVQNAQERYLTEMGQGSSDGEDDDYDPDAPEDSNEEGSYGADSDASEGDDVFSDGDSDSSSNDGAVLVVRAPIIGKKRKEAPVSKAKQPPSKKQKREAVSDGSSGDEDDESSSSG